MWLAQERYKENREFNMATSRLVCKQSGQIGRVVEDSIIIVYSRSNGKRWANMRHPSRTAVCQPLSCTVLNCAPISLRSSWMSLEQFSLGLPRSLLHLRGGALGRIFITYQYFLPWATLSHTVPTLCQVKRHGKMTSIYTHLIEVPKIHVSYFSMAFPTAKQFDIGLVMGRHKAVLVKLDSTGNAEAEFLVPTKPMTITSAQSAIG